MRAPVDTQIALRFARITKDFPGVRALSDVSLDARAGEVHAVLGENGAGKSTLVGIAAGSVSATSGEVELLGHRLGADGREAHERGLAIVHQSPALAPSLAVFEAFEIILPRRALGDVRRTSVVRWVQDRLDHHGVAVDARATVESLTQREAHLVEIVAAISSDPSILILDEPTEALGPDETAWLFDRIRALGAAGVAVIYITHRIPEVLELAAALTVLRDGRVVGGGPVSSFDADAIVELIIGRSLEASFPDRADRSVIDRSEPVLRVEGLRGRRFHDVSFDARAGEILGLAGVEGNGQREVIRALGGAIASAGDVHVDGVRVDRLSARRGRAAGIVFLAGDRLNEALFPAMSIEENVVAPVLSDVSRHGVVSPAAQRSSTRDALAGFAVRAPTTSATIASLSGGNQQKVLLGRSRVESCRVLLVEDPTQGVDAGARIEIYNYLRQVANSGVAVVVLSTDAVELSGLCDRVAVFSRGRVQNILAGENVAERDITGAAVMSTAHGHDAEGAPPARRRRRPGWIPVAGGDLHAVFLLVLTILLGARTQASSSAFLSSLNLTELLAGASLVILAGLAQMLVVTSGGIDLSIGATVALGCVISSFFGGAGPGWMVVGVGLCLLAGGAVGVANGLLSTVVGIPHVIATLVTSIAIAGVARIVRPSPSGFASPEVADLLQHRVGPVPSLFPISAGVAVAVWYLVGRTSIGRRLRATGSDAAKAAKMGVHVDRMRVTASALAGALAGLAGVFYYARTGIGDAGAGTALTLMSVTAIVIAGVNIYGGSGSALAVAAAGLLLQTITNSLTFLSLSIAWQYWTQGVFVLVAAIIPALVVFRQRRAAGLVT